MKIVNAIELIKKKTVFVLIIIVALLFSFQHIYSKSNNTDPEIIPGYIIVKLKQDAPHLPKSSSSFGIASLDSRLQDYDLQSVSRMFSNNAKNRKSADSEISRIIKVKISENIDPLNAIQAIEEDPNIEYAEPVYKRDFFDVPNDPLYPQQDHLPIIKAPEAWDIQKGDSNVIIAIADGGFDLVHEDLAENIYINTIEANGIAGVDDDENGYIDDINGWDFGSNDNDPSGDHPYPKWHGTGVAGIACAVTNNNIGVAGVSWNCKFMPLELSNDEIFNWYAAYEAIVYAADNGADIVSNSWGGFGYLQWEQDVTNYADNQGTIVVCAAGNFCHTMPSYPASYQNSISVAAVNINDIKTTYSAFGPQIDISAPSTDLVNNQYTLQTLLTTWPDNEYGYFSGTSGSCPVVAGVLGLVKSQHPEWSNEQVIRQVLLSADNINLSNPSYINQLGHGRINAFRALTLPVLPESDARLSLFEYDFNDILSGNGNGIIEPGDTVTLTAKIKNYSIGHSNTPLLQLNSSHPEVNIITGDYNNFYFPADTTLYFEFVFNLTAPIDSSVIELELLLETGLGYSKQELIKFSLGKTPILVLDYDYGFTVPGTQVESFYTDILDSNDLSYTYWDCSKYEIPEGVLLKQYPLVLMLSGCTGYDRFREQDRMKIAEYLDRGGNLFICGPNIGFDLFEKQATSNSIDFLNNYLHAEFIENTSENKKVHGKVNDPISDGLQFNLFQPLHNPNDLSADVIDVFGDSDTLFTYGSDSTSAIKYSGIHKVVYAGFGLESVDSDSSTQLGDMSPIRTELLLRILNWLSFVEHEPLPDTTSTTSQTITVELLSISPEILNLNLHWRLKGETVFNKTIMELTLGEAGDFYTAEIPGQSDSTIVEYYIEGEFVNYTWLNPINAPLKFYSYFCSSVTDLTELENKPYTFSLSQNYPNPFNPTTTIKYQLPEIENRESIIVQLKIYDVLGREIATLVNEKQKIGSYEIVWDASDFASGVYFYQLLAGRFTQIKKLVLIK